jgi:pyruvate dehydrogenase E2 component (dihydrolipoamide acetyltransferase)
MVEDESSVEAFKDFTVADAGGAKASPKPIEEEKQPPPEKEEVSESKREEQPKPSETKKEDTPTHDFGGPIAASPIARRLALERGVPLKQIKGTGPGGRIIKSDIEKYIPSTSSVAAPAPSTGATGATSSPGYTDIPLTGMRKTIARRLSESMFTAPHYYLTSSINMSKMLKLRKALNDAALGKDGKPAYRLSVNDFIVKAVGCALLRVPEANSQWMEKEGILRLYSYVDISVSFPLLMCELIIGCRCH